MTHILITGGAGFIGTHLARLAVADGHTVRVLDNLSPQVHGDNASFDAPNGVEFVRGDINDRGDIERSLTGIETIVHLAAETGTGQSMYEIERYYRVNVQGTAVLFDVLANSQHQTRNFVLASSRSVYGEGAYLCRNCRPDGARRFPPPRTPDQLAAKQWEPVCPACGGGLESAATREDDRLAPASVYAASKLAQEDLARVACTALGIPYAVLRFQNVYGEGQSLANPYTGILSIFSTRIRLSQPLELFEDGEETRDFVHVEDVAEAIMRSIDQPHPNGMTMNVGSGQPISVASIARRLQAAMGVSVPVEISGRFRVGDIRHNFADISKLKQVTGFEPSIALEEGLKRFTDWVTTQPVPKDLLDQANAELSARKLMA